MDLKKLKELKELLDSGALTQEEFDTLKAKLLSEMIGNSDRKPRETKNLTPTGKPEPKERAKEEREAYSDHWFYQLDDIWQELFLFNIEFNKNLSIEPQIEVTNHKSWNYYNNIGIEYNKPCVNLDTIDDEIKLLKYFIIDSESYQKMPTGSFQNILKAANITHLINYGPQGDQIQYIKDLSKLYSLHIHNSDDNLDFFVNSYKLKEIKLTAFQGDINFLGKLKRLKKVLIESYTNTDYSPIKYINDLSELILKIPSNSDLSFLSEITYLKELKVIGSSLDLRYIWQCIFLESLSFESDKTIRYFVGFMGQSSLNTLNISNHKEGYELLKNLKELKRLDITDGSIDSEGLNIISECSKLEELSIYSYCEDEFDISNFYKLRNLKELRIGETQGIYQHEVIGKLLNLKILALDGIENLENIDFISELKQLEELILVVNDEYDINLSPISSLTKLKQLTIRSNNISDLTPIESLQNLTYLDISHNAYTNLGPIGNLRKLEYLYIDHEAILDLSPLSELKNLKSLFLFCNDDSDASPIENLDKIMSLSIGGGLLKKIPVLENKIKAKGGIVRTSHMM